MSNQAVPDHAHKGRMLRGVFEVIPCVDIQNGRAVRLFKGDPNAETVYFQNPLEAARHWVAQGATQLHIVDLDAATGAGDNRAVIASIAAEAGVPLEVGGGVRGLDAASALLYNGVGRVVVGTVAVTHPEILDAMLERFGADAVVVSVDAKAGLVAVKGWLETSSVQATVLAQRVWQQGVRHLIYTDISRDGTLEGLDEKQMQTLREVWPGRLIAGGGVRDTRDLVLLQRLGIEGAIVGRALYEGTLRYGDW